MNKAPVKHIRIADKIYIKKEDVEDHDHLISLFTYNNGDEFISDIQEDEDFYQVPSNSYYKLEWETIDDQRNFDQLSYDLEYYGTLRPEQQEVADDFLELGRARSGILQAPCGWGKTYTSAYIIAKNKTKTLILVHTKLLFRQWIEELQNQIPNIKIGMIGDGLLDIQDITVGIYKSVYNNLDAVREEFSTVFVDEAHLCPADMFSTTLNNINAKIKIGISATPKRKDGKHVFLPDYFSKYYIAAKDPRTLEVPSVLIKPTDFRFTVLDPKRDWARAMNKLCSDKKYQEYIASTARGMIKTGRCPLILGDRVQMLKDLQTMIPQSACMIGSTDESEREETLSNVGGKFKAILSTKLFDEGISCHRLDTLFLTAPSNNPIKLEQRIGRIIREHPDSQYPLIVDFWLSGGIVSRQQKRRLEWYKSRGYNIL